MQIIEFKNDPIDITNLPKIETNDFHKIEKSYLKLKITNWGIRLLFFTGIFIAFIFISKNELPYYIYIIFAAVLVSISLFSMFLIRKGHPIKSYQVREKDISYQNGYLFYKLVTVPFNRIQHVEVRQNFFEKIFKISSIKIYTAGGNTSDLVIPGLSLETANSLKEQLTINISDHE
ncbi:MAG: PH domain-containing protein [Bacteroidales bacterium]|nr:PH domain-containing protein [Bacteroidales bacterium]